jgi:hypothetical protein
VIWHWRDHGTAAPDVPASRLRRNGTLQAAVGVVLGCALLWFGRNRLAILPFTVAGTLFLSAMLSPHGLYTALDRAVRRLAQRLGSGFLWVTMVVSFYAFFFPFGKLFRRGKNDRLKRFFQPDSTSYWEPHDGPTAASASHATQY